MDPLLAVIIFLGAGLLAVTAYMEWIGVMNLFSRGASRRYECGHFRVASLADATACWNCRHPTLHHAVEVAEHPFVRRR